MLAPSLWKEKHNKNTDNDESFAEIQEHSAIGKQQKSTWARLIKKVYGTVSLICPRCGSLMEIIAIIMEPAETEKILKHLVKIGRLPNFEPSSLN